MNQRVYRYAFFLFVLFAQHVQAQTTWLGAASNNWSQAANWSNGLPAPFNEPIIPASPQGGVFPEITVLTYFNFNVQNYGTLKLSGSGGITLFGTFINHANATIEVSNTAAIFLVDGSGKLDNFGNVLNGGAFNNLGVFTNMTNANFTNNHIFSHTAGSLVNQGVFNNNGQFFSESQFQNSNTFNNNGLFNNNNSATNVGSFTVAPGALLRNDFQFQNSAGTLTINGQFLNHHIFQNNAQVVVQSSATIDNSSFIKNALTGSWICQGILNNVLCAIFENKGSHNNTGEFNNEGFVYADTPIGPNMPVNAGGGVVLTPTNFGSLCHDVVLGLPLSGPAVATGQDFANMQFEFCTNWTILLNGLPTLSYSGCASLGTHSINVSFKDPFGRTTNCSATLTVVDNVAPAIACPPTLVVPLPAGQCTANPSLTNPTILQENCTVASIASNATPNLPVGSTNVTWTVTDQGGNAATCVQTVTVVDQVVPTISCPPGLTLVNTLGLCGVSSQIPQIVGTPASAFDNCGLPTVTNNAGPIIPVGTNILTWKATDFSGNMATCTQTITVSDVEPPTIVTCPSTIVAQAQLTACQAIVNWGAAVVTDNCGAPNQVFSIPSGSIFDAGTTPVTLTVSDASGNSTSCQFEVKVEDHEPPTWINCPSNSTVVLLDCGDVAIGDWTAPSAADPCLDAVSSNIQPGVALPLGPTQVVYTATDHSGNSSDCSFTINVEAQMAMTCPADIVVSVPIGETTSTVTWNTPTGVTNCTVCASTAISGFHFLGEKNGHRYYIYLGGQVSWQEAENMALQHGGYLATIGDLAENDLLRKEMPNAFANAWTGFSDMAQEGLFAWSNGEPATFTNWSTGNSAPQNAQYDFVLLNKDGFWSDENGNVGHTFLMEVPCYLIEPQSSNPAALSSLVFPLGTTNISYEYTDNCGNACFCNFNVQVVQNQQVASCFAKGNSAFGWIESVETEGFQNTSGNDGGHGNYTATIFELPDPGCILKLKPGGPATDEYLYWRIWADLNMDGDFFDDNEKIGELEGVGEQDFCYDVHANLPTGPVGLRIAMSRWDFADACGAFAAGEAEDYKVSFVDSSLFHPNSCHWSFSQFDGLVEDLKVKLHWIGNSNCHVKEFRVERSPNGLIFKDLAIVQAVQQGPLPTIYQFADDVPFYGKNYYRIRAILEDDSESFSGVFETDFEVDFTSIFVYPNPASTDVVLHVFPFNGLPSHIFIADAKGQIVYKQHFDVLGNEPIKFDLANYAPGIYSVFLQVDGKREQVRRFTVSSH